MTERKCLSTLRQGTQEVSTPLHIRKWADRPSGGAVDPKESLSLPHPHLPEFGKRNLEPAELGHTHGRKRMWKPSPPKGRI